MQKTKITAPDFGHFYILNYILFDPEKQGKGGDYFEQYSHGEIDETNKNEAEACVNLHILYNGCCLLNSREQLGKRDVLVSALKAAPRGAPGEESVD